MKFWVEETDIDGFRCDVAGMVPTDFWNETRKKLDSIKPVFMLAEAEQEDLHYQAFDMTYAWNFMHLINDIAQEKKSVKELDNYFKKDSTVYPPDALKMYFTTNHDENSWNGTVFERLGDAYQAMAVLTFTVPGMPLIYSGQEAGLNKRLKFFEKDLIDWKSNNDLRPFYSKLLLLKKEHPALWNGNEGGSMERINSTDDNAVFAFLRQKDNDKIIVVLNLSPKDKDIELNIDKNNNFKDIFTKNTLDSTHFIMKPWEFRVYINNN